MLRRIFVKGSGWIVTGIVAVAVGVSVLTCGVATPAMIAVAAITITAGVATTVNGVSEIGEAATGRNLMRDDVFQGNSTAYNAYAYSTATVAQTGTVVCGGWLKANQAKIADRKLEKIIENPEKVKQYSTKQFEKIANQSSWESGVYHNQKGYRAYTGNCAICYNLNGTRFDEAHFWGNPYGVISSSMKGTVKIPFE